MAMNTNSAVDNTLAKIAVFGSINTVADAMVPDALVSYRNKEMAAAVFASKFGASQAVRKFEESNRLLKISEKSDEIAVSQRIRKHLTGELMKATSHESVLLQEGLERQANEDILKERLEASRSERDSLTKELKRLQGETAKFRHYGRGAEIKIEGNLKNVSVMQMRIKHLQVQLEEANEQGKYVIERSHTRNIAVRELESELMTLTADNDQLSDNIEKLAEKKSAMEQYDIKFKDTVTKESAIAEVQVVALQHDLAAKKLEKEPLEWQYKDILDLYSETQQDMHTKQSLHEQEKQELISRLDEEEKANLQLVEEIAAKSAHDSGLLQDMAEEQQAKTMLIAQLEDKQKLCLQIQKRLHGMNQVFEETRCSLKARDDGNGELVNMVENLKSSVKVLNAKAKCGNEMSTKLQLWAREERADSDRLRMKLDYLNDHKSSVAMLEKEDEATKLMLKQQLKDKTVHVNDIKSELYHEMAVYDDMKNKTEEAQDALDTVKGKYVKSSAQVDKLSRELNVREREFRQKLEEHAMQISHLEVEKIGKANTAITNLKNQMEASDREVGLIENMLDEKAVESEHWRLVKTRDICELDEKKMELQTVLRQVLNRNTILDTDVKNGEQRIVTANTRQKGATEVAVEMKQLNSEESDNLTNQLKRELDRYIALSAEVEKCISKRNKLVASLELADHARRNIILQFRTLKHEDELAVQKLEDGKEELLQRTKMLEAMNAERARMQDRLDGKEVLVGQLAKDLQEKKEALTRLKVELKNAEASEMDFFTDSAMDRKNIERMEKMIQMAEEQHVTDGNNVRIKVTQLVGMLELKKQTVEKLELGVERLRQHTDGSEMRLEQTEAESSAQELSFNRKLDIERIKTSKYREEIERLNAGINGLRQQDLDCAETLRSYGDKLDENTLTNHTLLASSYRTDQKYNEAASAGESLRVNARVLQEEYEMVKKDLTKMTFEEREQNQSITELELEVNELVCQNQHFKAQIKGLQQRENVLLLRVEAERNHIRMSTGNDEADRHAEEALLSLLNQTNADELDQLNDEVLKKSDLADVSNAGIINTTLHTMGKSSPTEFEKMND